MVFYFINQFSLFLSRDLSKKKNVLTEYFVGFRNMSNVLALCTQPRMFLYSRPLASSKPICMYLVTTKMKLMGLTAFLSGQADGPCWNHISVVKGPLTVSGLIRQDYVEFLDEDPFS